MSIRVEVKRQWISLFLGIVVLTAFILFLWYHRQEFSALRSMRLGDLAILSWACVLSVALLGATLNVCSDIFGVRLKLWEWLALASVGGLAGYLPFGGALLVRGGYLRQRHHLPLTQFAGAMAGMLLITFFTSGLMGAMVLGWLYAHHQAFSLPLLAAFLAMALGSGGLMFFSRWVLEYLTRYGPSQDWKRHLFRVLEGWLTLRQHPQAIGSLFILNLLIFLCFGLRLYYAGRMLSYNLPFSHGLLMGPLAQLSQLVNILPGGLGVKEGLIGLTSQLLGQSWSQGLLIAALDRLVSMFWVFLLGGAFTPVLSLKKNENPLPPQEHLNLEEDRG